MTLSDKLREIAQQLLAQSKQNKVNWIEEMGGYAIHFPSGSKLMVTQVSPASEPDWARIQLTSNGKVVATLTAEDGDKDYELLKALNDEAYRHTTKWDVAIKDIEEALKSDVVGVDPAPYEGGVPF